MCAATLWEGIAQEAKETFTSCRTHSGQGKGILGTRHGNCWHILMPRIQKGWCYCSRCMVVVVLSRPRGPPREESQDDRQKWAGIIGDPEGWGVGKQNSQALGPCRRFVEIWESPFLTICALTRLPPLHAGWKVGNFTTRTWLATFCDWEIGYAYPCCTCTSPQP